jgi:hypothetical protein
MTEMSDHEKIYRRFLQELEEISIDERLVTPHWRQRCQQIKEDARIGNRFDFLRWPSLDDFSVPESWIPPVWYDELRRNPEWDGRWLRLTRESKIGSPKDFSRDFGTSPILVQHAYHLLRYETATNKFLLNCEAIFEVGGGYGSFCRLLRNSGFKGLHIIYDLPQMASIQRLYLNLSGFSEVPGERMSQQRNEHRFCLITDDYLDNAFNFFKSNNIRVAFVATWSLSETPMLVRERIFPRFHQVCEQYLIAFQPAWETISNVEYFDAVRLCRPELNWHKEDVRPHPSFYLFA